MNTETYAFLKIVGPAGACHFETIVNTYELTTKAIEKFPDAVLVECGVYAGAQIGAMYRACVDRGVRRPIHAFDSFKGTPKAGPHDTGGWEGTEGIAACSRDNFDGFMKRWGVEGVIVHEGWFEDTVPQWSSTAPRIGLLRLDGDLYSSTLTCLTHLYPRLVSGGYCIVDDYALAGCKRAVEEYFRGPVGVVPVEGGGGPVWLQKGSE